MLVHYYPTASTSNTVYHTTFSTTSASTANIVYNTYYQPFPEKFEYKYSDHDAVFLHPFEILIKKEITQGNYGTVAFRWIYTIHLEGKFLKNHYHARRMTDEELEKLLEEDSKKWLEKEMKSTWKTDSTPST